MKRMVFLAAIAALFLTGAGAASAQDQLPAPSPIEKQLAARAEHVTEVTLATPAVHFVALFGERVVDLRRDRVR